VNPKRATPLTFIVFSDLRLEVLGVHVFKVVLFLGGFALPAAETAAAETAAAGENTAAHQEGLHSEERE